MEQSPPDPLMYGVELPYVQEFHPLGFAVRITSNSPLALAAATESWSAYSSRFAQPPLEFRVLVTGEGLPAHPPGALYRAHGHLLTVTGDAENSAAWDLEQGFGFCTMTPAAIADRSYFRYYFLEGMVYTGLAHLHLTALHAACVALEGRGVLLFGDSGAGKTCLAYASARAGWTYVSDDAASLLRRGGDRAVLGMFDKIRFRPAARALFPELAALPQFISEAGQPSLELKTANHPGIVTALTAPIDHIVFLNRREDGRPELRPVSKADALRRITRGMPVFAPWVREEQSRSLDVLLAAPACELRYSGLAGAIQELRSLLRGVRA